MATELIETAAKSQIAQRTLRSAPRGEMHTMGATRAMKREVDGPRAGHPEGHDGAWARYGSVGLH